MKKIKTKFFENKKVLLVGLGILGGGTSMAKFIIDEGGELTITDLRNEELLKKEIDIVYKYAERKSTKVKFVLEKHEQVIFDDSNVVVFNPAVPYFSKWPQYCIEIKKEHYNDFTLFQEYLNWRNCTSKQIWITGTRGKTTTTDCIWQLMGKDAVIGGNVLGNGLQKICTQNPKFFVLETSNFQLEYPVLNQQIIQPEIAVLTNIFTDHINRHKTQEEYARVKNLIYSYNKNCILFLNKKEGSIENIWKNNLHENIKFISEYENNKLKNIKEFSQNQMLALSFAVSIANHIGVNEKDLNNRIKTLKLPKMRQEIIFQNKNFKIINDSAATSPDALISCINSFPDAIFISGGTNAELNFEELAKTILDKNLVVKKQIFFLKGTATVEILKISNIDDKNNLVFDNFEKIFEKIITLKSKKQITIILSPGAKSFGLFKNEYDRGEKFNKAVKKAFKV